MKEVERLSAQVESLEQRLGKSDYDPSTTKVPATVAVVLLSPRLSFREDSAHAH